MEKQNASFSGKKIAYKDLNKKDEVFSIENAEKKASAVTPNTEKCMATRMRTLNIKSKH